MPKVGEGWVEITTRVDQASLRNAQRQIEQAFDDIEVEVNVSVNTADLAEAASLINSAFEGITAEIGTSIDRTSLARTLNTLDGLLDAALLSAPVGTDVNQASLARARSQINNGLRGISANVRVDTDRSFMDRILGSDGGGDGRSSWFRAGNQVGSSFVGGFLHNISNAFQLNGPVGGAIILGLIGIAAAAMVPLGAMFGGLLTAGFAGAAGLSTAIVASIDSPEVAGAFDRLKQRLRDVFIDNENLDFISQRFATIIEKATDALLGTPLIETVFGTAGENPFPPGTKAHAEWMPWETRGREGGSLGLTPEIESILQRGLDFLEMFANGIVVIAGILIPAFDEFINSDFAGDAFQAFMTGLAEVALAIAQGWRDILNDPAAQEGMVLGVQDFFKVISVVIGWSFDFIRWLSRTWNDVRTDVGEDGRTDFDKIMDWLSHLGVLFKVVGAFLQVFFAIWKNLVWDNPLFWEFLDTMDEFLDGLANGLKGVAEMIDILFSVWDNLGGSEGAPDVGGGFSSNLGQIFDDALARIKTGGWAGLATWFAENIWNKLPEGATTALTDVGIGFGLVVTAIRTGDWSTLATWFSQNVWAKLVPGATPVMTAIGLLFTGTVTAIRTGDWSTLASWFGTNVFNKILPVATTTLGRVGTLFAGAVSSVKTGGWSTLATWFSQNVLGPIAGAFGAVFGALPRAIEAVGPAVARAIVNVVNNAIGKVRTAAFIINALPFAFKVPVPNFVGYAEGGWVPGPLSMQDNTLAAVATGEFIVNARAAARNGPMLEAINEGRPVGSGGQIINVWIDGVKTAHRATIEDSQRRVIQHLGAGAHI